MRFAQCGDGSERFKDQQVSGKVSDDMSYVGISRWTWEGNQQLHYCSPGKMQLAF